MWNELRRVPISFLFVICDCGAVCLSRKQFHKKLSAFIQFSEKKKKKHKCLWWLRIIFAWLRAGLWSRVRTHKLLSFNMRESNCVNLFVYQSRPVVNVVIVLQIPCSRDSEMGCFCRRAVKLQHACSTWFLLCGLSDIKWMCLNYIPAVVSSTVLACIWCHVGGKGSVFATIFKDGIKRREQERRAEEK